MLREIQAFEACWLDLKDSHPTNREDKTLIAQAMGQLVDGYRKPGQVESDLPEHLRILFRRLALAYFQGYFPAHPLDVSPESTAPIPVVAGGSQPQHPEIAAAVAQVKQLAAQARTRMQKTRRGRAVAASEIETLIIEFPEPWPSVP
jgi:alkanesulfonate monooxygenase SsuD/methylene tetrahydromethanopterin reductase-like flavin-dependent oxidoreductase (luciferase family)